jgi:lactoylglutathione lyase
MHPFTVLADPVRRRIVETLARGERSAGEVVEAVGGEFGISQPAISQHLRVLREHGFAHVRREGPRRLYLLDRAAVEKVDRWLAGVSAFWAERMDDLAAEVGRGDAVHSTDDREATATAHARQAPGPALEERHVDEMQLGAFSVSLAVRDLEVSRAFYEKLGFHTFGGDPEGRWLILKNGDAVVGLFQGMFETNVLTFNPGWDRDAKPLARFTDVRELQRRLREAGVAIVEEADEASTGPAHFVVVDPDGNPVLVDQHV